MNGHDETLGARIFWSNGVVQIVLVHLASLTELAAGVLKSVFVLENSDTETIA